MFIVVNVLNFCLKAIHTRSASLDAREEQSWKARASRESRIQRESVENFIRIVMQICMSERFLLSRNFENHRIF